MSRCPVCSDTVHNYNRHILTEHPGVVNDHLTTDADKDTTIDDESISESVIMPGRTMNNHHNNGEEPDTDPRECNDCNRVMSASYARVFANNNGTLYCPDCRSRSERYTTLPH